MSSLDDSASASSSNGSVDVLDPASPDMLPSSPTSSATSATSAFAAPLGETFSEISIDGSSVCSSNGGLRPERLEDVTEEDKAEALRLKAVANKLFQGSSTLLVSVAENDAVCGYRIRLHESIRHVYAKSKRQPLRFDRLV